MLFTFRATTRLVRRRNNFSLLSNNARRRLSTPSLHSISSSRKLSSSASSWNQALQSASSMHPPQTSSAEPNAVGNIQTTAKIINPKKDEEGQDMIVEVTPRAVERLRQITDTDKKLLRVTVESGGCHGFQYLMELVDESKIDPEEDTIFDHGNSARVVMDEPSLGLLKGSKLDYTMELIGSQFKIVGNPRASSSCGCGTSFDIQF